MDKNEKNLISIVVPIYNAETYLNQCIKSIIEQSYKNIEIILINDGSTDDSGIICDEYAQKDIRIKVIHNKNQGVSISRNIGIQEARGEYISFVDADDFISKKYVEILYQLIIKDNAQISTVGNDEYYEGKMIKTSKGIRKVLHSEEAIKMILKERDMTHVCWGKMYKKELFDDEDIKFDSTMKIGEDLKIIIPIIEKCKKISIDTREKLYHYRKNEKSITQQKGKKDLWIQEIELSKQIVEWTYKKYPKVTNSAIQRYVRVNITFLVKMIKESKKNLMEEIKQVKYNIKGYKIRYIFFTSSKIQDKIKLILIICCPNLLIKLYNVQKEQS